MNYLMAENDRPYLDPAEANRLLSGRDLQYAEAIFELRWLEAELERAEEIAQTLPWLCNEIERVRAETVNLSRNIVAEDVSDDCPASFHQKNPSGGD